MAESSVPMNTLEGRDYGQFRAAIGQAAAAVQATVRPNPPGITTQPTVQTTTPGDKK